MLWAGREVRPLHLEKCGIQLAIRLVQPKGPLSSEKGHGHRVHGRAVWMVSKKATHV